MKIITVFNRKGGVAKTVTSQAIASKLNDSGKKVLCIDIDSQANLTNYMNPGATTNNILDVLLNNLDINQASVETPLGDIIPSSKYLSGLDTMIPKGVDKITLLKEALNKLRNKYNYIVIDAPPSLELITVNALVCSDYVIIPCEADIDSIQGLKMTCNSIDYVIKEHNSKLNLLGVLVTRWNGRSIISKDMLTNLEHIADKLGTSVFNTHIRECVAIKEAKAMHQSIYKYDKRSNAAIDYEAFMKELMKKIK